MRREATAALAAAILGGAAACTPPAPPPPPPPGSQPLQGRAPDHVELAVADLLRALDARGLHKGGVGYWREPAGTRLEAVRDYYAGRLAGWAPVADFPQRTLGGRAAAWRSGVHVVAFTLIEHPDAADPSPPAYTVLAVVSPDAR